MIQLIASSSPGEVRIAAVARGVVQDFALWRPGRPDGVGDILRARVIAHVPGMAGAFLALPEGDGFLPDSEGGAGAIEGTTLTVRITRAAQGGKGARLTAKVEQQPGTQGRVAAGPSPWAELTERYPEAAIVVDDPALAAALPPGRRPAPRIVPAALDDYDDQVAALSATEIDLPGGLKASIHPTPALVAIDVDMAAATAGRRPKAEAQLAANRAALPELARQIRLRNLSGAILIDVAGLSPKRRAQLGPALIDALSSDPLRPRLLGFTALGLAEIVRPRIRPALHELLAGPHATAIAALRTLAREAAVAPHVHWRLLAAPEIAAALEADTVARADLARRTGRALITKSEPALAPAGWRIERDA